MSIHIGAEPGDVAELMLLPGDPLRAEYVAGEFLSNSKCYNTVRGMLGYTGTFNGKRISVQGSGMGQPSLAIYVNELINSYNVRKIIRIGSCGSFQKKIKIRDIILAMSASTDSAMNRLRFHGMDFAPCADFDLLYAAYQYAIHEGITVHAGGILASDSFYQDDPEQWKLWASYNVLGVEMESSALYTICAAHNIQALSILTVSDSLADGSSTSSDERQKTFSEMVRMALAVL